MKITKEEFIKLLGNYDFGSLSYTETEKGCVALFAVNKTLRTTRYFRDVSYNDYINLSKWLIEWYDNKPVELTCEQKLDKMLSNLEFELIHKYSYNSTRFFETIVESIKELYKKLESK